MPLPLEASPVPIRRRAQPSRDRSSYRRPLPFSRAPRSSLCSPSPWNTEKKGDPLEFTSPAVTLARGAGPPRRGSTTDRRSSRSLDATSNGCSTFISPRHHYPTTVTHCSGATVTRSFELTSSEIEIRGSRTSRIVLT